MQSSEERRNVTHTKPGSGSITLTSRW